MALMRGFKDQLAPHEMPDEFEDLVDLAVRIGNCLQEREAERRRAGRRSSEPQGACGPSGSFVTRQDLQLPPQPRIKRHLQPRKN
ncbi:hypothetical protein L3Q82_003422 [Scortum barcoo]|uniref:Uncharacterized protein n=1 Tax=Scortum barcoo TaxID=214431 RepID=A0ACB8VMD2_9TELE|nr:hypothetical protein L3Q82_003422 [Scortum barcoo]